MGYLSGDPPALMLAPDRPVWFGADSDGERCGIFYEHPRPDGSGTCQGWVPFGPGTERWDLVSMEPLTLQPSLLCIICGDHGFITNGTWVAA